MTANWYGLAKRVAVVAFVAVAILIAWPEPPAQPLVAADGWEVQGGFQPLEPPVRELRRSVRDDPGSRYWRSWDPSKGSQPGVLRSAPFVAAGTLGVPYNGFAGEPGIGTFIECLSDSRRLPLATGRNNTQWSEVLIRNVEDFCAGPMRVVAVSSNTQYYVALGTPYQLSWLSSLKQSSLVGFWFVAFAWAVVSGWFFLFAQVTRFTRVIPPAVVGLAGVGLIGYAQFFIYWQAPLLGAIASLLVVLVGFKATTQLVLNRQPVDEPNAQYRRTAMLWLGICLAYAALAFMADSGAGPWEINGRFTPARWSTDNQLPAFASRLLVSGNHQDIGDFSAWSLADRPPLAYGWHAIAHRAMKFLAQFNDGQMFFAKYQLAIGLALNSSWIALLSLMLPRIGVSGTRLTPLILVLAICPFFIFNDLFVWPKLLSGAFGLAAAWLLLGIDSDRRLRDDAAGLIAAALLSALAIQTHGGSAFGVLAAIGLAAIYRGMPTFKGAVLATLCALAVLLPWFLWQRLTHISGNALVKFAFAGTFGFGEDLSVFKTIARSYAALSIHDWLAKKWDGTLALLFGLRSTCGLVEMGTVHSTIDRWRASDFFYVIPSLNALVLGFATFVAYRKNNATWRAALRLVVFAIASIALTWLLTWDCFVNHTQSYQALIALHLGLALSLMLSGIIGRVALALVVVYGLAVWVLEPVNHFARFDILSIVVLVALAGMASWRMWLAREREEALTP